MAPRRQTIEEINVSFVQGDYQNPPEPTLDITLKLWGLPHRDVKYWTGTTSQTVGGGSVVGITLVQRKITFAPVTTAKIRLAIEASVTTYSCLAELET